MTTTSASDETESAIAPSRADRLDRLPFTREHGKLLAGSGIGWALDAMDVGLISFVMVAVAREWSLDATTTSWIASIGFVGMAIGASVGGLIADRIGRRQVFALTLLVYGLATGASALSASVGVLIALRFLVGLGLGAELPVASTLVSEYAPARIRGRVVVWLESFWAVGWLLAALIGRFVVGGGDDGWRWALVIGVAPAVYAVIVRMHLPESVRFLESKRRYADAEAAVREFERSAGVEPPSDAAIAASDAAHAAALDGASQASKPAGDGPARVRGASIWSPSLRRRTVALWTIWFCINFSYYGAFTWIPSLLVADGFDIVKSFTFTLIITLAQVPGYAAAAWLIERWGRRATLAVFLAGSAVAAGAYGLSHADAAILVSGILLSFFNLGAWGALYAIGPELYPTALRGTGSGAAAGFGRIASILAPLAVPPLILLGGGAVVFGAFALAFVIAAAAVFLLPELRGTKLQA